MTIPTSMKILHDRDFSHSELDGYTDEPYFRLHHTLAAVIPQKEEGCIIRTAGYADIPDIVDIINASYDDITVSVEQITALTSTQVYAPELWLIAVDVATNKTVGCAIADIDREEGEGILEWVQVLPGFRRRGIGRMLVTELLFRMAGKASFATVSGRCDNQTNPEKLYRSCGFQGDDIWHIMRKI